MAEYTTVANKDDFASGDRIVVEVAGKYVAVFMVGGTFYAIEDICTHDDGPLAEGELNGTEIECPRHGARFDIKTGKVLSMPATQPVTTFPVRLEGDDVQILI